MGVLLSCCELNRDDSGPGRGRGSSGNDRQGLLSDPEVYLPSSSSSTGASGAVTRRTSRTARTGAQAGDDSAVKASTTSGAAAGRLPPPSLHGSLIPSGSFGAALMVVDPEIRRREEEAAAALEDILNEMADRVFDLGLINTMARNPDVVFLAAAASAAAASGGEASAAAAAAGFAQPAVSRVVKVPRPTTTTTTAETGVAAEEDVLPAFVEVRTAEYGKRLARASHHILVKHASSGFGGSNGAKEPGGDARTAAAAAAEAMADTPSLDKALEGEVLADYDVMLVAEVAARAQEAFNEFRVTGPVDDLTVNFGRI